MFRHILLFSTFICTSAFSFAASPHYYTLNNGLKVVIQEDHRSPLVMVQIWYGVGGVDEPLQSLGISHLLEHMMFKGTIKVPDNQLKQLNAFYGGSLNAITNANATYYYQLYPKDVLGLALELEADRMSGLYLQHKNFDTEKKVVMEERRQKIEDVATVLGFEKFKFTAYPQSNYKYPVMGEMSHLTTMQLSELQQWYNVWYRPNNATVVIVGDVKPYEALWEVQRYFGDLKAKALPTRNAYVEHPINVGYRHVDMDSQTLVPNLYMGWNVPSIKTATDAKDPYALLLLKYLLNGQSKQSIERSLQQDQQLLAAINLEYDMIQRGDTLFTITAVPHQNITLKQAQNSILNLLNELKTQPIDQFELNALKDIAKSQYIFQQDSLHGQAVLLGSLESYGIGHSFKEQFVNNIDRVRPEDIQHLLQTYFNHPNLTTLYLQSEKQRLADQHLNTSLESIDSPVPSPTIEDTPLPKEQ